MPTRAARRAIHHPVFRVPEPAPEVALPTSPRALRALLRADHATVVADVTAQAEAFVEAEVERRIEAEVARQVAARLAEEVRHLIEVFRLQRHRVFGRSSEANLGQGRLFNEAEQAAAAGATEDTPAPAGASSPATPTPSPSTVSATHHHGGRQALPATLPRVEVKVEVPEADRLCTCGKPMVRIGDTVSERLDIVPMAIRVIRTVRPRYACPEHHQAPIIAPAPLEVLPHSQFGPGFLAILLTVKYADALPLNRFSKVLARHGVSIPRQSLARAVIETAKALQPLHNLARDALLESVVIHMDETPVQVLKEPDKRPGSQGYMWVQRGGPPERPVILYDYDPSRSGDVARRLLAGWQGYLMTDGYQGYAALARQPGIEHLVCMAHTRRKFVEAKRAQPQGKSGRADQALAYFAQLYRVESEVRNADPAQRFQARLTRSRPLLARLRAWLDQALPAVTPRSKLGEALAYLHRYWPQLVRYTERGDLPIDNNPCENAIRPFVVGRKGWMFSDTPAGARASAVIYSLIETAKANGAEPYAWLRHVLTRLPRAQTADQFEALMPWNLHTEDLITALGTG